MIEYKKDGSGQWRVCLDGVPVVQKGQRLLEADDPGSAVNDPWYCPQWFCPVCLCTVPDAEVDDWGRHEIGRTEGGFNLPCGARCVLRVDGASIQFSKSQGMFFASKYTDTGMIVASCTILTSLSDGWPELMTGQQDSDGTWSVAYDGGPIVSGLPSLKSVKLWMRYRGTQAQPPVTEEVPTDPDHDAVAAEDSYDLFCTACNLPVASWEVDENRIHAACQCEVNDINNVLTIEGSSISYCPGDGLYTAHSPGSPIHPCKALWSAIARVIVEEAPDGWPEQDVIEGARRVGQVCRDLVDAAPVDSTVPAPAPTRLVDLLAGLDEAHWLTTEEYGFQCRYLALSGGRFVAVAVDVGQRKITGVWDLGNYELDGEQYLSTKWWAFPVTAEQQATLRAFPTGPRHIDPPCTCRQGYCCDACWAKAIANDPCPTKDCPNPAGHVGPCGRTAIDRRLGISEADILSVMGLSGNGTPR